MNEQLRITLMTVYGELLSLYSIADMAAAHTANFNDTADASAVFDHFSARLKFLYEVLTDAESMIPHQNESLPSIAS